MKDIFNDNVPLKTETPAFAKHVLPAVPSSDVYLEDCVKALKRYADNHFDLAIVDPPYGLGLGTVSIPSEKNTNSQQKFYKDLKSKRWDDNTPNKEYFDELKRVSKNQIVWGGNYMAEHLGNTKYIGVAIAGFLISYLWVSNVKKANIATKKDQIIYSLGAMTGGLSGLFITSLIL